MCTQCDDARNSADKVPMEWLFDEPVDYFAEYRVEPEYHLSGVDEMGMAWRVSVAQADGTRFVGTGTQWILHMYEWGSLVESEVISTLIPGTPQEVAQETASYYFGYGD